MSRLRLWCYLSQSVFLVACGAAPIFPPELVETIDRTLTFDALKADPARYHGTTIELGGQIVGSQSDRAEVRILVRELPIRIRPVYGPVETERFRGLFVVIYSGTLTAQDLQHGNMIVVVGTVMGMIANTMTGSPVSRITVNAGCLHIWRTGGAAIDDFPWPPFLQGYWPLIEQTYCSDRRNTLLNVS